MSGWIKWEKSLETDPHMIRMVAEMKRLCNATAFNPVTLLCGAVVRLWSYADTHIRQDNVLDLGAREIDEYVGIENFCSLMPDAWLREIDEKSVELPGFLEHNGVEAKKKASTQKRVERHRKRTSVTSALPDQTRPDLDQTRKTDTSASPPLDASLVEVFEHWQKEWGHPDAKLDDKRKGRIKARLKTFSASQLCDAISGFKHSAWHTGTDPKGNGTVYDKIETLLRDDEQVEVGLRLYARPPRPPPLEPAVNLSPGEIVARAYEAKRNGSRVVAEQTGSNGGGVEEPIRRVWPALPA